MLVCRNQPSSPSPSSANSCSEGERLNPRDSPTGGVSREVQTAAKSGAALVAKELPASPAADEDDTVHDAADGDLLCFVFNKLNIENLFVCAKLFRG